MRIRWLFLLSIVCLLLTAGFSWGLPSINIPQTSIIYDINGNEIKGLYQQNRISVNLNEISPHLIDAFIAVEDRNFYRHHGIDIVGIGRALLTDIRELRIVEGGSTITQQTAKNLFLTQERTITRKIKELAYTIMLERKYSKDEILEMYLNTIYFGQGAYGVETAARTYFGKSAAEVDLAESALLAGIPVRPNYYNPLVNPEVAKKRQKVVLQRMVQEDKITAPERDDAWQQPLDYKTARFIKGDAPYFADMVVEYLVKKYGARAVYQGGMKIYTGLDLDMQAAAQAAYDAVMKERNQDLQAALVAVDTQNGYIKAMIGGRDYSQSPFNRAVKAKRQPGSSFKPFLYALAIDSGYTEASLIKCEPVEFPQPDGSTYKPTDYGQESYHYRDFTLKEAIMLSDNIVAVKLNDRIGPENYAAWVKRFGFSGSIRPYTSLALGTSEVTPLEMATAFTTFANQGFRSEPLAITRVVDREGRVLEKHASRQQQTVSPQVAYIITDMLKGVLEPGGTASHLKTIVNRPAAGKTGTTQEYRDAWFVGFTPQLSCAVWVGYDTQEKSVNIAGGRIAGPIWASFLREGSNKLPVEDFTRPEGITQLKICLDTGLVATESCPRSIGAAFFTGTEPEEICYYHQVFNWFGGWDDDDNSEDFTREQTPPRSLPGWIKNLVP